jgi:hypothetical protein
VVQEGAMDTKVDVTFCAREVTATSINFGHQACRDEVKRFRKVGWFQRRQLGSEGCFNRVRSGSKLKAGIKYFVHRTHRFLQALLRAL